MECEIAIDYLIAVAKETRFFTDNGILFASVQLVANIFAKCENNIMKHLAEENQEMRARVIQEIDNYWIEMGKWVQKWLGSCFNLPFLRFQYYGSSKIVNLQYPNELEV